jgi:hypothetical protein
MPNELYLVRLIHNLTGRPFPGERLWTAAQLVSAATIRFLRARNCEGCDVYIHPYAGNQNAGYILVDLDRADPRSVDLMRASGHDPCVGGTDQPRPSASLDSPQRLSAGAGRGDRGRQTPGTPLRWRLGQHRLASLGTARWIYQSKTRTTHTRPIRPVGATRPRPCGFGAARRVVVGVRQAAYTTADLAVADRLAPPRILDQPAPRRPLRSTETVCSGGIFGNAFRSRIGAP